MPVRVGIIGGGLSGLSAAAALASAGHQIQVLEGRPFLGGRATSYEAPGEIAETIDNCQHILLRCCVNLLDFYKRLGVEDRVAFQRDFYFIEPGGRTSILRRGIFPAPAHFAESFLRLKFLSLSEKIAVARAIQAIDRESATRKNLDRITMQQWLEEKHQPPRAIERFWRQVLVSAINEELDRMAASHGFQVFRLGFIARSDSYEMGIPNVPLGKLYSEEAWKKIGNVELKGWDEKAYADFLGNRIALCVGHHESSTVSGLFGKAPETPRDLPAGGRRGLVPWPADGAGPGGPGGDVPHAPGRNRLARTGRRVPQDRG